MNRTINFFTRLTPASSGVVVVAPLPLAVPDKLAFRVRYVDFRYRGFQNVDVDVLAGVSKVNRKAVPPNVNELTDDTTLVAFNSWAQELTTTGATALLTSFRVELWEYDYRMVMPPTALLAAVGGLGVECWVVIGGEMVPASTGQRNAIIAWQGGLWNA